MCEGCREALFIYLFFFIFFSSALWEATKRSWGGGEEGFTHRAPRRGLMDVGTNVRVHTAWPKPDGVTAVERTQTPRSSVIFSSLLRDFIDPSIRAWAKLTPFLLLFVCLFYRGIKDGFIVSIFVGVWQSDHSSCWRGKMKMKKKEKKKKRKKKKMMKKKKKSCRRREFF